MNLNKRSSVLWIHQLEEIGHLVVLGVYVTGVVTHGPLSPGSGTSVLKKQGETGRQEPYVQICDF